MNPASSTLLLNGRMAVNKAEWHIISAITGLTSTEKGEAQTMLALLNQIVERIDGMVLESAKEKSPTP